MSRGRARFATFAVLACIIALGAWLRLAAVEGTSVVDPLRADAAQYFAYAFNLKYFRIYSRDPSGINEGNPELVPDSHRPPGYPLFLYPLVTNPVSYDSLRNIYVVQAIVGVLVVLGVYLVGIEVLPRPAALLAALLTALSPHLVNAGLYVLTETVYSFVLIVFLLWLVRANIESWRFFAVAGAILAVSSLVRPTTLYFIVILAGWFALTRWKRPGWRAMVLCVLGFLVVYSPWAIRNRLLSEEVAETSLAVRTLHHGMYPGFMYNNNPWTYKFPYDADPRSAEIGQSAVTVLKEIQRRFREEPVRHLEWYLVGKPVMLWSWNIVQGMGDAFVYEVRSTPYATSRIFEVSRELMKAVHYPLVFFMFVGMVLVWFPGAKMRYAPRVLFALRTGSLLLAYFTLIHMGGAPFPRYSVPLRPLGYLFALIPLTIPFMKRPDETPSS